MRNLKILLLINHVHVTDQSPYNFKNTISIYSQFSHANFPITIYHYHVLKIGLSIFPLKTYQRIKEK